VVTSQGIERGAPHLDNQAFNVFSTVTTLGTPQDITLQEIRIECFFPLDKESERQLRELEDGEARPGTGSPPG